MLSAGEDDLNILEPQIVELFDSSSQYNHGFRTKNESFSNQIEDGKQPMELLSPSQLKLRLSRLAKESMGFVPQCPKSSGSKVKDLNVTVVVGVSNKEYGYFAGLMKHLEQDMVDLTNY